ncbi:MAG: SpoIID/LytB domain-containing protein [Tissierellia bacterium]|nr:SpoIID/LytB domain-containing protein [Tissierellia bacterium]
MKKLLSILLASIFITASLINAFAYNQSFYEDYFDIKVGKSYGIGETASISSKDGLAIYLDQYAMGENLNTDEIKVSLDSMGNLNFENYASFNNYFYTTEEILIGSISKPSKININGRNYHGFAKLKIKDNKLICINRVELEDYLKGVLPKEMSPSFPIEALKAQAVASRSFAKTNRDKYIDRGYNLDDTTYSQVYYGIDVEKESTNRAVDETFGQLVYYNGEIAETIFHATSGGRTESAKNAWGKHIPYMISVEDEFSNHNKANFWELEYSLAELESIFNLNGSIGNLLDIEILERTDTQRVKELNFVGSNSNLKMPANKFRSTLGNTKFKSNYFEIEKQSKSLNNDDNLKTYEAIMNKPNLVYTNEYETIEVVSFEKLSAYDKYIKNAERTVEGNIKFVGKGYGHGVGMSQYGAVEMAKRGYNYIDILKFYYPGTEIR